MPEKNILEKLEGIEKHLKKQDYEIVRAKYLTMATGAGVAVALVGFTLAASKLELYAGAILSAFLMLAGLGFIFCCVCKWQRYKTSKMQEGKKVSKKGNKQDTEAQSDTERILAELKRSSRRTNSIFLITLAVWVATQGAAMVGGWAGGKCTGLVGLAIALIAFIFGFFQFAASLHSRE